MKKIFSSRKVFERYKLFNSLNKFILNKKLVIFIFSLDFLTFFLDLIPPYLYMIFINEIFINNAVNKLVFIIILLMFSFAIQTFIKTLSRILKNKVFYCTDLFIKKNLISRYMHLNIEIIKEYGESEIKDVIINDTKSIHNFLENHIYNFTLFLLSVISYIIILLVINYKLAFWGICMIPLSYAFTKIISQKAEDYSGKYRNIHSDYEHFLYNSIKNWKEIRTNLSLPWVMSELTKFWNDLSDIFIKYQKYWYINRFFVAFKETFVTKMSLYFLGGYFIYKGYLDVGILLMFLNYYEKFVTNISSLIDGIISFDVEKVNINKVLNILCLKKHDIVRVNHKEINNHIIVKNLNFKYKNSKEYILKDINLEIYGNGLIAVVGMSGSGKSTLSKVLVGLYEYNGYLLLNGLIPYYNDIHEMVVLLNQDPTFFNMSIWDNLKMINDEIEERDIDELMKKLNLFEFIHGLPQKYNTILGENGVKLSGGQRQRLALARAIIAKTNIILIDEGTSALDQESERMVINLLMELAKSKLIISITHHKLMYDVAKEIIEVKDGRIILCEKEKL